MRFVGVFMVHPYSSAEIATAWIAQSAGAVEYTDCFSAEG